MAEKKSFALRMNAEMMKALEKWAADEFRSTNGQIEWIVQEALKKAGRLPKPDQNSGDGEVPPEQAPSS
ncbi:Arc family DNA-binding protein [Rufibacter sediminis]|uniref:Arc family DNA-binding protein n=1 Tax=Rufibacter sediminis TaxID=2762756 RepID=A0ABR6VMZ0_9BACT|nr:Arc family DNA-binding protein [Rufibacter sediminis]MBC3538547.1 Arc family DNA-binding protein [Rufibacter sediminis]